MRRIGLCVVVVLAAGARAPLAMAAPDGEATGYNVVGDAIPTPLTNDPGNPARGRAIVVNRQVGLCLLCHSGPFAEEPLQGTLAPDLSGTGARLTAGQLRLRLVDSRRVNPVTIMPSYFRTDRLTRVGAPWRGKPVLTPQQIEDVVALLVTLRE